MRACRSRGSDNAPKSRTRCQPAGSNPFRTTSPRSTLRSRCFIAAPTNTRAANLKTYALTRLTIRSSSRPRVRRRPDSAGAAVAASSIWKTTRRGPASAAAPPRRLLRTAGAAASVGRFQLYTPSCSSSSTASSSSPTARSSVTRPADAERVRRRATAGCGAGSSGTASTNSSSCASSAWTIGSVSGGAAPVARVADRRRRTLASGRAAGSATRTVSGTSIRKPLARVIVGMASLLTQSWIATYASAVSEERTRHVRGDDVA